MTKEQLDQLNAEAVRRHYRTIGDQDGRIPQALLDDLALIAGHHVITEAAEVVDRGVPVVARATVVPAGLPLTDDLGHPVQPDGSVVPESPQATKRRAARVRGESTTT